MNIIYLIGFMGSGKTTIGERLQVELHQSFVDVDRYIESKTGMEIPIIFQIKGEKVFRQMETEALEEIQADIISTGGGIVEKDKNMTIMKQKGTIIYLKSSFQEISSRLQNDQNRPLWNKDLEERKRLYHHRCKLYESFADFTVNTDRKTIDQITKEVKTYMDE